MRSKITRRKFILGLISGMSLLLLSSFFVKFTGKLKLDRAITYLDTIIDDYSISSEIGQKYLLIAPKENTRSILISKILGDEGRDHMSNKKELYSFFIEQVKNDYKNDDTVKINGWVFSKTEARLCALSNFLT